MSSLPMLPQIGDLHFDKTLGVMNIGEYPRATMIHPDIHASFIGHALNAM